jgi:hypothetical protein
MPFVYVNTGFPPKVLIQNPTGRPIPDELLEPLNGTRWNKVLGAEYNPCDLVMWVGPDDDNDDEDAATLARTEE